jgi:glycosyltransferase involved in cell wall biosynthesis
MGKRIVFTVINELNYDQRMQRICGSLAAAGYEVCLVGRDFKDSPPLSPQPFDQKRLRLRFSKGKLYYIEFTIRLFWWLLFRRADLICAIDLDTIIPVYLVSKLRRIPRVYDAHELFCEMKEVVSRPFIYACWKRVEKYMVPRFPLGYTVNQPIAGIFKKDYGVDYKVVRNVPKLRESQVSIGKDNYLLYQGAVNEGRLFELLIPAMQWVDRPLHIYGDGNFLDQTRELIKKYQLEEKVLLKGKKSPAELKAITARACLGFTLFENKGLSNYYSLANRFFDYVHAGTPQICSDFPVYRELNKTGAVAVLITTSTPEALAGEINNLLENRLLYEELQQNCLQQRERWNWETEEKLVIQFYHEIFQKLVEQ